MKKLVCKAGLLAGLVWLLAAAAGPREARILEVESQGYSRFEIEGDSVVAYFPEPVIFRYLGYEVSAGNLRYDQSAQLALASGGVVAVSSDYSLEAAAIRFDGAAGIVSAEQGVTASASKLALTLRGNVAELSFPPEVQDVELKDCAVLLRGQVSASDAEGSLLTCEEATFNGGDSSFSIPGSFQGRFRLEQPVHSVQGAQPIEAVIFSGQALRSRITKEGMLESVAFENPIIEAGSACFTGESVVSNSQPASGDAEQVWDFTVLGSPARGQLVTSDDTYRFASSSVRGTVGLGTETRVALKGDTEIWSKGQVLHCASASLTKSEDRLSIELDDGLEASYDLSQLSGMEPMRLTDLQSGQPH